VSLRGLESLSSIVVVPNEAVAAHRAVYDGAENGIPGPAIVRLKVCSGWFVWTGVPDDEALRLSAATGVAPFELVLCEDPHRSQCLGLKTFVKYLLTGYRSY
jgi:hypothetical protein